MNAADQVMQLIANDRRALAYRPLRHGAAIPVAATLIAAALLAPYRFLKNAVLHKRTHLSGVQPVRPPYANLARRHARLNPAQSDEVDRGCIFVREIGERVIFPLLRDVEAEEQGRRLVSLDQRFKDANRLKQKIARQLQQAPGHTPTQGLAAIPDAVRFTLQYQEGGYVAGVRRDVERLRNRGLTLVALRNTWSGDDLHKGIDVRWREPSSGLLFEVQFHTQASFAARELTHTANERIRGEFVKGTRWRNYERSSGK